MPSSITASELQRKIESGDKVRLFDVRTPAEFREVHIPVAENVPLDQLDPASMLSQTNGEPIYVVCRSGSRGQMAAERLESAGVIAANVEGGTQAWVAAGFDVIRGKKTMSLERQVRIAAGSLVVLGAALGFLLHPAWIGLSAFVGAGLVFAGVTDTCGMGMLLAKAPWNQVKDDRDCQTLNAGEEACCSG